MNYSLPASAAKWCYIRGSNVKNPKFEKHKIGQWKFKFTNESTERKTKMRVCKVNTGIIVVVMLLSTVSCQRQRVPVTAQKPAVPSEKATVPSKKPAKLPQESAELAQLPSGPEGPGQFGAYYTKLKYNARWDEPWRVGDYADVVVRFDDGGHKFVFWRGTSYIPCWVTDTGIWYTNEFVERRGHHSPNTRGCVEPMSDKQCRFSHVRIIENTDARVVVHWRYAPIDVRYEHPFIDPLTGWSDWVDEYYTIYPNAVGVRKITVHTTRPDLWTEFQEAIVVNQPGTMPDDNIELGAVSLANMKGESKTYYWTESGGPEFDAGPKLANIFKINLKASLKPFALVTPPDKGVLITPYEGHGRNSHFNWWDHWPVAQVASDGRRATSADKPSHSSLCHIGLPGTATAEWKDYAKGKKWRTKIMLHGMTEKHPTELTTLARSWLNPPQLFLRSRGYTNKGYDQAQRAYILECHDPAEKARLKFEFPASNELPLVNPAFIIKNWGNDGVTLQINRETIERGKAFRYGHVQTPQGTDLIIWIELEEKKHTDIRLSYQEK